MSSKNDAEQDQNPQDRRAHVRHRGADLTSIRGSRLKHGRNVSLIDLSEGGALIEADVQLRPGARLALEIAPVNGQPSVVVMRVLRCELTGITPEGLTYRGACAFTQPLQLPGLLPVPEPPRQARSMAALDASLKMLAERYRKPGDGAPLDTRDVLQALRLLQTNAAESESDGLVGPLAELLPTIANAVERREAAGAALKAIEARLRTALPAIDIRLADASLPPTIKGAETIIFKPEHGSNLACVLNVQVPSGAVLETWQFRLLKASMHLCSLLDVTRPREPQASASTANGSMWQKMVVRYKDGALAKGFSTDFHPTRDRFSIWPSVNAPESERIVITTAALKAVFFVRDFDGNPNYVEEKSFDQPGYGRRIEVTFFDNEMLVGTTTNYRADAPGFFLNPADPRVNNLRVFVVATAIRQVRFLDSAGGGNGDRPLQFASA
jgi:PilZ domain